MELARNEFTDHMEKLRDGSAERLNKQELDFQREQHVLRRATEEARRKQEERSNLVAGNTRREYSMCIRRARTFVDKYGVNKFKENMKNLSNLPPEGADQTKGVNECRNVIVDYWDRYLDSTPYTPVQQNRLKRRYSTFLKYGLPLQQAMHPGEEVKKDPIFCISFDGTDPSSGDCRCL
jgi:hypothetical protein